MSISAKLSHILKLKKMFRNLWPSIDFTLGLGHTKPTTCCQTTGVSQVLNQPLIIKLWLTAVTVDINAPYPKLTN